MNFSARTNEFENEITISNPLNQFKILEYIDEEHTMFLVKRYSDSKKFFVKTELILKEKQIISKKLEAFGNLKMFLLKSKIDYILIPEEMLICTQEDSKLHVLVWKIYESIDHVLWNQYYTGGFRLQKKYVVRHFNETEMFLVSQSLVSSLILLFSKGKIPSFHNFFVCLSNQQYKLYFDSFDDIRHNPVMSFVDFDEQSQKIAIKKVIHKKSRMPPPELEDWDRSESRIRKSRREQMRSLKQVKLRKKHGKAENRVKSLKREDDREPKYPDVDAIVPKFQIPERVVAEKQPREYAERVHKRYEYVRERLNRNLFSSFLVTRFESLLDYAIVLIYGFLKDIVFAFYDIRVQNTQGLRTLYQQDKLDQFKNLLGLFFFMLKKQPLQLSSSPQIAESHSRKLGETSLKKDSDRTANTDRLTLALSMGGVINCPIQQIKAKKLALFSRLDHFFQVSKRVISEFLNKEIEFPNIHWGYLQYPVFKHMRKLSLVYCGGVTEEPEVFQELADILPNLQGLSSLNLGFSA